MSKKFEYPIERFLYDDDYTNEDLKILELDSNELQNIVEQTVVLATTQVIPLNLVQKALQEGDNSVVPLDVARQQFEFNYLINLLKMTEGNVSQAAKLAQRNRTEFYRLLDRHHIQANTFKASIKDNISN